MNRPSLSLTTNTEKDYFTISGKVYNVGIKSKTLTILCIHLKWIAKSIFKITLFDGFKYFFQVRKLNVRIVID